MNENKNNLRKPRLHPVFAWIVVICVSAIGLALSAFGFEFYLKSRKFDGYTVWPPRVDQTVKAKPGLLPGISGPARITTNKYGIRARDFSFRDDYRILAIGGSTTECIFLDDTETWAFLLGKKLEDKLRSTRVWVGNVGKSGHTTRNHIEVMEKFVPQLSSIDAVFLMVGINDMSLRLSHGGGAVRGGTAEEFQLETKKGTFVTIPEVVDPIYRFPRLRSRIEVLRHRICGCEQVGGDEDSPYVIDAGGVQYEKWRLHRRLSKKRIRTVPRIADDLNVFRANLNELIDLAERQNIRVVFATQPTIWHHGMSSHVKSLLWFGGVGPFQQVAGQPYYTVDVLMKVINRYNRVLKTVCEQRQVECVDLAAIIPRDTTAFYDDCHFNENGARLVADAVAELFLEKGKLRDRRRK